MRWLSPYPVLIVNFVCYPSFTFLFLFLVWEVVWPYGGAAWPFFVVLCVVSLVMRADFTLALG